VSFQSSRYGRTPFAQAFSAWWSIQVGTTRPRNRVGTPALTSSPASMMPSLRFATTLFASPAQTVCNTNRPLC